MKKKGKIIAGLAALTGIIASIVIALKASAAPPPPPPPPPGKANLYGVVSDASTGQPLSGVSVTLDSVQTQTNSSGRYTFTDIEPETYNISFSKAGYVTKEV